MINGGIWELGLESEGDCDGCSVSDDGFIGLLLPSLNGGDAVPSSLWGLEPSPPFVVMIPLVLEGGRTLSSVLVGMIESRGDCDLVLFSEPSAFSPRGIGDAEVTGGSVNVPVIDEGECALRRVLDPGFVR